MARTIRTVPEYAKNSKNEGNYFERARRGNDRHANPISQARNVEGKGYDTIEEVWGRSGKPFAKKQAHRYLRIQGKAAARSAMMEA